MPDLTQTELIHVSKKVLERDMDTFSTQTLIQYRTWLQYRWDAEFAVAEHHDTVPPSYWQEDTKKYYGCVHYEISKREDIERAQNLINEHKGA